MAVADQGKGSVPVSEQRAGRHLLGAGCQCIFPWDRGRAILPWYFSSWYMQPMEGVPQAGYMLLSGQPEWGDPSDSWLLDGSCDDRKCCCISLPGCHSNTTNPAFTHLSKNSHLFTLNNLISREPSASPAPTQSLSHRSGLISTS